MSGPIFVIGFFFCAVFSHQVDAVSKCYFCNGECTDPLEEVTCRNLTDVLYGCISSAGVLGAVNVEWRGCVNFNNTIDRLNCERLNNLDDSACYMCALDFCNSAITNSISMIIFYGFVLVLMIFQ